MVKTKIKKVRVQLRPKFSSSFQEIDEALKNYEPLKSFYQGIIQTSDSCGLLFSTPKLFEKLANADRLFVDNTVGIHECFPYLHCFNFF